MSRFSDWAKVQDPKPRVSAPAPARVEDSDESGDGEGDEEPYLVDNSQLQSRSRGILYRASPALKDTASLQCARFGSIVHGCRYKRDWLKVGRRFLPMKVQGVTVLLSQRRLEAYDAEEEEDSGGVWANWKLPKVEKDKLPAFEPGSGAQYEVVGDRIAIRAAPSLAAPLQSAKVKGDVVDLYTWDGTRKWRQVMEDISWNLGWVLLDHPDFGPLLRPKGLPFQVRPLEPIVCAVHENHIDHLRQFVLQGADLDVRDAGGYTPLMLAAGKSRLECCAILIKSGADPTCTTPQGNIAADLASTRPAVALIRAMTGNSNFDPADLRLAVDSLLEDVRMSLEGMFPQEWMGAPPVPEPPVPITMTSAKATKAAAVAVPPKEEEQEEFGELFEVTYKAVAVRKEPSIDAERSGMRTLGDIVDVLGFDDTGQWVRIAVPNDPGCKGWMLTRHDTLGQLLRPLLDESLGDTSVKRGTVGAREW